MSPSLPIRPTVRADGPTGDDDAARQLREQARSLFATALGVSMVGVLSAAIGGALCPVCVVAAPLLAGAGAYKRWLSARRIVGSSVSPARVPPTPVLPDRNA